jgi:hypothetical protein
MGHAALCETGQLTMKRDDSRFLPLAAFTKQPIKHPYCVRVQLITPKGIGVAENDYLFETEAEAREAFVAGFEAIKTARNQMPNHNATMIKEKNMTKSFPTGCQLKGNTEMLEAPSLHLCFCRTCHEDL